MSVFSYSHTNFSKVQNTLSGRKAMLLEDKLPEEIALKQIKSMNLPVFQNGCYHLQPSQLY